jgi:hypothetical protein
MLLIETSENHQDFAKIIDILHPVQYIFEKPAVLQRAPNKRD